jgi:hypothetical protein
MFAAAKVHAAGVDLPGYNEVFARTLLDAKIT